MLRAVIGFVRRYPFIVLLVAMVACEFAMMYLILPRSKAEEPTAAAETADTTATEIHLGEFRVRNHQIPGDDHIIKFSICLTLPPDKQEQVETRFKQHEQRAREAIAIVARRAGPNELGEPTLSTLKRRIRVAIAAAMHHPESGPEFDVVMPDFLMHKG